MTEIITSVNVKSLHHSLIKTEHVHMLKCKETTTATISNKKKKKKEKEKRVVLSQSGNGGNLLGRAVEVIYPIWNTYDNHQIHCLALLGRAVEKDTRYGRAHIRTIKIEPVRCLHSPC